MSLRHGGSVLCVDDDTQILKLLQDLLTVVAKNVQIASNGYTALATLKKRSHDFDVVVTDLRMPGMSGTALIEQARAAGYARPFIVYSGAITEDDRQRLRELNVTTIIEKPGPPGELMEAVRQAIR